MAKSKKKTVKKTKKPRSKPRAVPKKKPRPVLASSVITNPAQKTTETLIIKESKSWLAIILLLLLVLLYSVTIGPEDTSNNFTNKVKAKQVKINEVNKATIDQLEGEKEVNINKTEIDKAEVNQEISNTGSDTSSDDCGVQVQNIQIIGGSVSESSGIFYIELEE